MSKKLRRLIPYIIVAGFICLLSRNASGEIIHVPTAEYPNIQSGINAASSGDTVLVADGTYHENILFPLEEAGDQYALHD